MAGTLVADVLQDGAGNSTAMDNAIYGSAKAWVRFAGASGTITSSYNVSSVTRSATGVYAVNMTNAMANANYCANATSSFNGSANYAQVEIFSNGSGYTAPTSSSFSINCATVTVGNSDPVTVNAVVYA